MAVGDQAETEATFGLLGLEAFERFFETSAVPSLIIDLVARQILAVNEAALRVLEMDRNDVIGRSGGDFLVEATPDELIRVRGLRGDDTRIVREVRTASGPRTAEINLVASGVDGVVFVQAVDLTDILEANLILEQRTDDLSRQTERLATVSQRMAHDLRGPLASISGFAGLLVDRPDSFDADAKEDMLRRIASSATALGTMVAEIMTETVAGDDKPEADDPRSVTDLEYMLRAIFDVQLAAVGGTLTMSSDVDQLPVDRSLVQQPIVNLISNGIQYRHPDRPIDIRVEIQATPDETIIAVADNGRGFDPSDDIFAAGRRADSSQGTEGSGLGLAFTKSAMASIGGSVSADALAVGSRFSLRLPTERDGWDKSGATHGGRPSTGLTGQQLDDILKLTPIPVVLIDLSVRQIVRVNQATLDFFGMPEDELVGRPGREILEDPTRGDELRADTLASTSEPGAAREISNFQTATGVKRAVADFQPLPNSPLAVVHIQPLLAEQPPT